MSILEEATREKESAAAEVRRQETGLAAAKAVLEEKVIINGDITSYK